tara:strand:- start:502 stop:630 length:129 start_codon:yes stop_codon:yes gene_type:complete
MNNYNFENNYDSIPKLNKKQMKIFKIVVGVLLVLLIAGMLLG